MSANSRWDDAVRDAIIDLERRKGDWVDLVALRPKLDWQGTSRAAQDDHLQRMAGEGKLNLDPGANSIKWIGKR